MTVEELTKTHPDYDAFLPEWQFYIRSYLGGKFYRDGDYLLKHPFESDANYTRRKEIAYFYNYCAPIVDIFTSYLTKKQPVRSYGNLSTEVVPPRQPKTLFDAFWWDVDLENTNLEQFMRDAQRYASIYGRISIIVDKPSVAVLTQAQAKDQGVRPYCYIVTPENLLDWEYMRLSSGRPVLTMVKVKEEGNNYRIWTRYGWSSWRVDNVGKNREAIQTGEGFHDLGEIPIVNLYNKKSLTRMIGVSDLQDIADINKNIYYFCSDAKEIIENTAFPMLAMPYDKGGDSEQTVGPKNILQFDPEMPNSVPRWLEPPHSSLAEIREWIQQDAQEMVRIAKMGGLRNTETSVQPWSGVSIEAQERQLFATLAEKASNSEQAELDIFRLWAKWEGKEFTGNVEYPRDFAIRDLTTALQNAISAGTQRINSLTFEKARQKKVVNAVIPDMEEVQREAIFKEIEELEALSGITGAPADGVSTPDNADGTKQIDPTAATVQDTALNGAQVTALMNLVLNVSMKQLPPTTAKAIIKAAFPFVESATIEKIINSLTNFKPQAQTTPAVADKDTGA